MGYSTSTKCYLGRLDRRSNDLGISSEPQSLASLPCYASRGTTILGIGFVLAPEEAERLRQKDPRNAEVLFAYLNAIDFSSSPSLSGSREVINFLEWDLAKAQSYIAPFGIVYEKVRPQREKPQRQVHEPDYWKFSDKRPELYRSIASLGEVLVCGMATKYFAFAFVPTRQVFADKVGVFATGDRAIFSILSSSLHGSWATHYMYTLKGDPCYSLSACFQTYAFCELNSLLRTIGNQYHEYRHGVMTKNVEGLTKTYNRFHDREETTNDIQTLRDLHVEMDKAVAAAYGWSDLDLGHGIHETKQGVRFTISESARREILSRLLKLNHERYAEEVKQGLHDKKGKTTPASTGRGRKSKSATATPSFLDDDEDDPDPPVISSPSDTTRPTPSDGDIWYFAYGSNLSVDRKVERTGAIRQAIPSRLVGYRFAFNKRASEGGRAYANVVRDPNAVVWGVAYLCNPQAMKALDRHEGVSGGHYKRLLVEVTTSTGEKIKAVTYVAGEDFLIEGVRPSDEYLRLILDGARHHALPEEYIRTIESEARGSKPPTGEPPIRSTPIDVIDTDPSAFFRTGPVGS